MEGTKTAATMKLSKETKRAIGVLSKPMNSVCYMYDAYFSELVELHKWGSAEELVESVHLLFCDLFYNLRRGSELENTGHEIFHMNDMDTFCYMAKRMTETGFHGRVFRSALQISVWRQRLELLTKGKEFVNDGEKEKVKIRKE